MYQILVRETGQTLLEIPSSNEAYVFEVAKRHTVATKETCLIIDLSPSSEMLWDVLYPEDFKNA